MSGKLRIQLNRNEKESQVLGSSKRIERKRGKESRTEKKWFFSIKLKMWKKGQIMQ